MIHKEVIVVEEKDASGKVVKTFTTTKQTETHDNEVKPRKKKTYAFFVLDESGSMGFGKPSTIAQYNQNLDILASKTSELGEVVLSMIKFSNSPSFAYKNIAPQLAPRLSEFNYVPNLNTALNDAIGMAIDYALDTCTDINEPDVAILVNVFTDGQENHSTRYSAAQIKEKIAKVVATDKWTFTTVAPEASRDFFVKGYGFTAGNFFGYQPNSMESRFAAGATNSASLTSYSQVRSMGATSTADVFKDLDPTKVKIDLSVKTN